MSDWLYCAARNGTQALKHDGQALYPWVTLPVAKATIREMMPEQGEQKLSPLMSWLCLTHWLGCASQITCPCCVVTLVLLLQTMSTSLLSYLLESHENDWEDKASLSDTERPRIKNQRHHHGHQQWPWRVDLRHICLLAPYCVSPVSHGPEGAEIKERSADSVEPALPSRVCSFVQGRGIHVEMACDSQLYRC